MLNDADPLEAALDRAFETAFADRNDPTEAPEVGEVDVVEEAPAVERARGPDGKFVAKDAEPEPVEAAPEVEAPVIAPEPETAPVAAVDAPQRFSAEAKAAWGTTPPAVQAEINRAFSELERGVNEYRAKYEPVRQYAEMAEQQGTTLAAAMANYIGLEDALRANPIQGLDRVCQNLGLTLRDVAAHVMGQQPEPVDAQVQHLSTQLQQLKGELAQYRAAKQRQDEETQAKTLETVSGFASSQPRFAELQHQIAWALKTEAIPRTGDAAKDLQNAYEFAARLIPAAVPAPVAALAATAAPTPIPAQTRRAGISIDGAPGSNPTVRPKAKNSDEAVDRSFDHLGL